MNNRARCSVRVALISLNEVAPCNHEETDTRLFLHAKNATEDGSRGVVIKASDTNVVVIAVSVMSSFRRVACNTCGLP